MKKSVLIAPVLGILLVGAAGSVGGTVAWFSSVNTFNTSVSSFAVGRVEGALDVTMTAGTGTLKVGESIVVGHSASGDAKLTHGSFNHGVSAVGASSVYTIDSQSFTPSTNVPSGTLSLNRTKFAEKIGQVVGTYTFKYDGAAWDCSHSVVGTTLPDGTALPSDVSTTNLNTLYGINLLSGTEAENNTITVAVENTYKLDADWMRSATALDGTFWYYAVSWTMTFNYSFGADTTARNIYLNVDSSTANSSVAAGTINTKTGFRLGFHNRYETQSRDMIWAPNQTAAKYAAKEIHYINGTANANIDVYDQNAAESVWYQGNTYKVAVDGTGEAPDATHAHNYIGQIVNDEGEGSLEVTCVAWFEGSDPSIMNKAVMDDVTAVLNFFALPAA